MLAKDVSVNVYGMLSERGLYSAEIVSEGVKQKAYVVGKRNVFDSFTGIVTAIARLEDGKEVPVVSPKNEIMYEPEIRAILETLRSIKLKSLSCLYEKSCGAVILHRDEESGEIMILLVKNHNGRFYSFPKGHVELRENEKETAVREIKEETNLDVKILDGFREISDYCPFGKIRKRVVFFLAVALSNDIRIQESEIDSYTWVPLNGAVGVTYDNDRRVIDKVKKFIEKNNIEI